MVFQHYALFPHLNVEENISYGPRQRSPRPSRQETEKQVDEMLEMVRLPGFQKRRVWELSGGEQQRVVLARALINRPTVLLLDEPLAALDRKLRREMQMELQSLQREVGITFLLVTHDQEEALSMSDTISIMRDGRIVQTGTPAELYDAPVSRYVADFVGESNFFAGVVSEADSTHATIRTETGMVLRATYPRGGKRLNKDQDGVIAVRPEVILMWAATEADPPTVDVSVRGRITNRIYLGHQAEFSVVTDQVGEMLVRAPKTAEAVSLDLAAGNEVFVGWQWNVGLALVDD
jgi:spermidine/putrescine transport system ATP-binding protein